MSEEKIKKLTPTLRFKEFEKEGEWQEHEVGEIFQVTRGNVLAMELVDEHWSKTTPYPVYSSQTKNNGLAGYYRDYLFEDAITWTTDGANAGDVNYRRGKFYCTNVCGVLINKTGYANLCVAALINSISRGYVSYVGNPKLMNGVMSKIRIPLPTIREQQKIADCLSSLDDLISAESQKLDSYREHKKGLMQQLFPAEGKNVPQLRFKEFKGSGKWKEKTLGKIGSFTGGGTPSKENDSYWKGNIPWVSSSDIFEDTIHQIKITRFITEEALKNSATKEVPENSILIVSRVGVGKLAISQQSICTSQDFTNFTPYKGNSVFLAYYLKAFSNKLLELSQGMAIKGFTKDDISKLKLSLPDSENEQNKIANGLSSLDALITAQSQRIEALKLHKKGLMQQLFPTLSETETL